MTPAEWIAVGQLVVGVAGVSLVWQGIRQMRRAGDQREKREDARHTEAMRALDARHTETMRALDGQAEALRALVQGLESQGRALAAALRESGRA